MDADHARDRLDEERSRLTAIKDRFVEEGLSADSEEASADVSSLEQHQADVGTETHDRSRDFSILEQVEGELSDVEHALKRLDDGTYGTCEACNKPIADARLEALPMARFCVDDQSMAEREARATTNSE